MQSRLFGLPNIRMEQIAAVVTVFAGSESVGQKQSQNPCQSGLRPDASAAHPGRYSAPKKKEFESERRKRRDLL